MRSAAFAPSPHAGSGMDQEQAELLAIRMIEWLAQDEKRFDGFMRASGATVDEIRSNAAEPEFLASVVDHMMASDARVAEFCDEMSIPCETPMEARRALPGGDAPWWT